MQVCCVSYLFDVENYCCSICWAREEEIWVRWPSDTDHVVEVAPQAFVNAPVLPTNALLFTENAARGGPHSLIQSWFWKVFRRNLKRKLTQCAYKKGRTIFFIVIQIQYLLLKYLWVETLHWKSKKNPDCFSDHTWKYPGLLLSPRNATRKSLSLKH